MRLPVLRQGGKLSDNLTREFNITSNYHVEAVEPSTSITELSGTGQNEKTCIACCSARAACRMYGFTNEHADGQTRQDLQRRQCKLGWQRWLTGKAWMDNSNRFVVRVML
ncbi:hypothetical protein [Achromobacter sp. ESBL13]|uniref:hypothetical protein n=1 Tax=Achromobacter sp. ESBL13 TaxID=3077328 RepID=UPI002FC69E0F